MNPVKVAHLSWVRGPIEKHIERSKLAMVSITNIRSRIENPPVGAEPVWFVTQNELLASNQHELCELITRIASALEVIQSAGGSTLVIEASTLASVSCGMDIDAQGKALLAIQNALQILPNYIGMVIDGAHDSPGVLLKYINEMRVIREVPQLNDDSALAINLSFGYKSSPLYESDCDLSDRERVFKKATANFCHLYTQALKQDGDDAWMEMRTLLRELQRVTNDPEIGSYWWVGEAIIDVIIADSCYFPPAMTTALRVVMVATQRLQQGEVSAKAALSPAKFSSLLNALSISRKKTTTSIEVVAYFDVKQNVEEERIIQLQEQLATRSVQTIADVLVELKPRLESAMIAFGRAVSAKSVEAFNVQTKAFDQSMRTIANITGIFNEGELSELSFYLADSVKSVQDPSKFTPEVIETVKTQILFLDTRLNQITRNEAAYHLQIENVTADVIERITNETTTELKKVSHMIATHVASGVGSEKLLAALDSLRELASVYEFAGAKTIAKILGAIVNTISDEVFDSVLEESDRLTLAARALVCLEMYVQYISSGLQPPQNLIELANAAVRELGMDASEFTIVSHSDLLSKFEPRSDAEDGQDTLLREIFEVRPHLEEMQKYASKAVVIHDTQYAQSCLRLSAAAMIKGEKKLSELCKHAAELSRIIPGRVDDQDFDSKPAFNTLVRVTDTILRCMDDYSRQGKVNLFLLDVIREVEIVIGHLPATANEEPLEEVVIAEATTELPATGVREVPDGFDQELQALFAEEFADQISKLREYLDCDNLLITEKECRAIHNIHGCSGSADCQPINTLFDVLEARFYSLKANEDALTPTQAQSLRNLLLEVESYQQGFPWITKTELLPNWIEVAGSMVGTHKAPVAVVVQETESEAEEAEIDNADHAAVSAELAVEEQPEAVEAVERAHAPVEVAQQLPAQVPASFEQPIEPQYDLSMYDLYLADADDVIPELQSNIQEWMGNMADKAVTVNIRRNMHTLKGAAGVIRADAILSLTHHMESLFDSMASGAIKADQSCAELATFVLGELITMSDSVRRNEPYRSIPALVYFVSNACDMCHVDGEKLAALIKNAYGSPAPAPASIATDTSSPAVAITLEPVADVIAELTVDVKAGEDGVTEEESEEEKHWGTRRGYRGARGRAYGERQKNYENRQAAKSELLAVTSVAVPATAQIPVEVAVKQSPLTRNSFSIEGVVFDDDFDMDDLNNQLSSTTNKVISPLVQSLIHKAAEGDREAMRVKRKGVKGTEKIKVELSLLDNSVKLSNELKASAYRQNTLHREMQLSVNSMREKLSLLLMHSNKTTVQLRNFNNLSRQSSGNQPVESEEQRLYLERFNQLSHSHNQSIAQIEQLLQDAHDLIGQSDLLDTSFNFQNEVVSGLQRDLLQSRLVMFDNEKPSLIATVAAATRRAQKKADLEVLGTDTRIDRQLLESVRDPLRHVVNNAIAHGIESEEERFKAGKAASGKITVRASRRSKSLLIEVTDDGRGIDPKIIHRKAISIGLVKPDDVLTEQQILHLIAEQGFSTASAVTELSGRGVGMDIVRSSLVNLGGHLHISSTVGTGTTFTLELPLTVGSNRAIICPMSDQWFAIPTFNMVQVLDMPTTELMAIKAKPGTDTVEFEGRSFDLIHLADLLAVPDLKLNSAQVASHTSLVLIEQGQTRLAVEVESGISMPEIHVTKFDGIMSQVKGIIGSTEVHDGTPALVIDVIEMARLNLKMTDNGYKAKLYRIRRIKREERPMVLIVDDSSSYRTLLTRHFETRGWEVATAINGQDALDKLPTLKAPDLFVVDVEMPRMNGLDLTKNLRKLKNFDSSPILMLTTLANLKENALSIGVDYFLNKPYDAAMLSEAVRTVCPLLETACAA
jgi:chemotaxis protein histidine kinase CheA/ActR/RegA family two-component response regulator